MNDFEWDNDTLEVQDDGYVTGSAYVVRDDGYSVDVTVTSYEYNDGEEMNHVPSVIVSDEHGSIVREAEVHDSSNPERAIDRAKNTGQNLFENLDNFVE